ncbi:hypothetical protein G4O51_10940 [Candidatus Bathyarchaeota archaeon A05DMB-2]|jgi:hypothetical protein|nr:hypothetical protein [Candidatus Bathyarchaeota archaeon A05DMB-2]
MPNRRRLIACTLEVVAGVLLLLSGIHGPTGTYELINEQLPNYIQNQQVLQVVNTLMLILIAISLAGGFAVIAGGILIFLNRVGTGKFIISLGAGVGLLWLILLAITLITTQQVAAVIAEYSSIGWAGIILAFAARIIAK